MKNLIERIQIWLGWKKVVIIVVDARGGLVRHLWATGSDIYRAYHKGWDLEIDYNNQKVKVERSKHNPRLYLD